MEFVVSTLCHYVKHLLFVLCLSAALLPGSIGSELTSSNVSVFVASDAGNTWRQVRLLFHCNYTDGTAIYCHPQYVHSIYYEGHCTNIVFSAWIQHELSFLFTFLKPQSKQLWLTITAMFVVLVHNDIFRGVALEGGRKGRTCQCYSYFHWRTVGKRFIWVGEFLLVSRINPTPALILPISPLGSMSFFQWRTATHYQLNYMVPLQISTPFLAPWFDHITSLVTPCLQCLLPHWILAPSTLGFLLLDLLKL